MYCVPFVGEIFLENFSESMLEANLKREIISSSKYLHPCAHLVLLLNDSELIA